MARAGSFYAKTGEILIVDPYHLYMRDVGAVADLLELCGQYSVQVDEPTYLTFRFGDIVRRRDGENPSTLKGRVFVVDGGSVMFMEREFLDAVERSFDPELSSARVVEAANTLIEQEHGVAGAILLERGAAKGKAAFVGDGEYYFQDDAFRPAKRRK